MEYCKVLFVRNIYYVRMKGQDAYMQQFSMDIVMRPLFISIIPQVG